MTNKTVFLKSFLFFFISISIFSQEKKSDLQSFYIEVERVCTIKKERTFCKAFSFYRKRQYDSCYVYSSKALLQTSLQNEKDVLNYIQGVSALKKNLYKKALENILAISDDFKFQNLKTLKLARTYLSLKDYQKAIKYYTLWEQNNNHTDATLKKNAYHNLGIAYIYTKKFTSAKEFFDKELALIKGDDTLSLISTKMELANVYYRQYLDNDAIPLFTESYELAKIFSDIELKQNTAINMAVVERNRKNYKESVRYYREYIQWKDSIWNRDKIWELAEQDKKLALAQKQQEIAIQEAEIKRQKTVKNSLLVGGTGLLIFVGILIYFYRDVKRKNGIISKKRAQLKIANTTKDYLFSVVSHDLRSPINILRKQYAQIHTAIEKEDFASIKKTTTIAMEVTESTHHLLNNVLHWSLDQSNQLLFHPNTYPLSSLIINTSANFKGFAKAKQIDLQIELAEDILVRVDADSFKIMLRNLVDNAIKYTPEKGSIKIISEVISKDQCSITVKDTGIGIQEKILKKIQAVTTLTIDKIDRSLGVGLGLLLCQKIIQKNKGTLSIHSEVGKGTSMTVLLPIIDS